MEYENYREPGVLPFKLCAVGEFQKQPPLNRKGDHRWNQIIWVKEGRGIFKVGNDEYTLSAGEGIFMRHNVPHSYKAIGEVFHTGWVTFESDDGLVNYALGDGDSYAFKCPDFIERETANLLEYARSEEANKLLLSAIGYNYVAELFVAITKCADEIIDKTRDYLIKNYQHPISLDEIAGAINLDKYSLCRHFAAHHSRSVMDELKEIRIARAKQLLRYSTDPVEEIGKQCGFDSPSYFALRFKEVTGKSPLEYRKQYR